MIDVKRYAYWEGSDYEMGGGATTSGMYESPTGSYVRYSVYRDHVAELEKDYRELHTLMTEGEAWADVAHREARIAELEEENAQLRERMKPGPPGTTGHMLGGLADTLLSAADILELQNENEVLREQNLGLVDESNRLRAAVAKMAKEIARL